MKNKIITIVAIMFGLFMANSGVSKFTNHMPTPELPEAGMKFMIAMVESGWLLILVGIVEILGGVLTAIPRTQALGAVMLLPIILGILLFNIFLSPSGIVLSAILILVNFWILWSNKEKYAPMIGKEVV